MFIKQKDKNRPFIQFRDFWEIDEQHTASSYRKLWTRIENFNPLALPTSAKNRWKWVAMVASFALLTVSGLYVYAITHPEQQVEIAFVTDRATELSLSDGTKVWISAHSKLRYPTVFNGKTRDVVLEGEAYFEVAHNSKQAFRVMAGGQTVVALGTSFNVRAFAGEPDVKVALVEGSVSVKDNQSGQAVVLIPAQEASISKSAGTILVTNSKALPTEEAPPEEETVAPKSAGTIALNDIDVGRMMSWKTGKYVFDNMPFEEIAQMLEKGFKVKIQIENEVLKSKPFTMRFENGESLEEMLELIRINAKYSYYYYNGIIIIK